eukprot:s5569_g1.t19
MEFSLCRWHEWQFIDENVKTWVNTNYMERFPTVEAQEVSSQFCSYEILFAFKKMFNTHLQTMLCGACFLQAARAWPEEILCKASALSSFDLCTRFYHSISKAILFLMASSRKASQMCLTESRTSVEVEVGRPCQPRRKMLKKSAARAFKKRLKALRKRGLWCHAMGDHLSARARPQLHLQAVDGKKLTRGQKKNLSLRRRRQSAASTVEGSDALQMATSTETNEEAAPGAELTVEGSNALQMATSTVEGSDAVQMATSTETNEEAAPGADLTVEGSDAVQMSTSTETNEEAAPGADLTVEGSDAVQMATSTVEGSDALQMATSTVSAQRPCHAMHRQRASSAHDMRCPVCAAEGWPPANDEPRGASAMAVAAPLRQGSQPTIGAGSTSATRCGEALCCDVTLVSPLGGRPQPGSRDRDGAKSRGVANSRGNQSWRGQARRGSWCWRARWASAGAARPATSFASWSECGLCELPPPCALPPRQAGGAGVRPGIHTARWHLAKPGSDGQPTLSEIVELAEPTLPSLLPLRAL